MDNFLNCNKLIQILHRISSAVDVVLAIVNLSLHFFPNPTSSIDKLIKKYGDS